MKQNFLINATSLTFILTGILLKALHSPGASIILVLGILAMLAALLIYTPRELKAQGVSTAKQMLPIAAASLLILGALFRIQHWPGASVLVTLGTAASVLLAIEVVRKSDQIKLSQQWITTMVLFLVLLGGVLPNNAWAMVFSHIAE